MIAAKNTNIVAAKDANTKDIMQALIVAVPGAAKNLNTFAKNFYRGNEQEYIKKIVDTVRQRVTYKKDGFKNQNIKYPGRLLQDGNGDCKSLSLFAAGAMTAAGIKNGFSFAAYRPGAPTHVYNYYINYKGEKIPFDLCINNLGETKSLNKIDMNVNYLAEPEIGRLFRSRAERQERREERRENRQERREDRKEKREERRQERGAGGGKSPIKKLTLAPGRGAALLLIGRNFRSLANKLQEAENKKPGSIKQFWNRVGGDYSKLQKAISKGAVKKPFIGEGEEGEGVNPAEIAKVVGAASGILGPLLELLKKLLGKKAEDKELENSDSLKDAPKFGAGFQVNDPEPGTEAASAGGSEGGGGGGITAGGLFKNPLILVGGAALLFILLKKK